MMSRQLIQTNDNSRLVLSENELCHLNTLKRLAKPTISELISSELPNLLIFPKDLDTYGDKIGDSHIFEVTENKQLITGNIMGFIGYGDTKISIRSRFAKDNDDYFLHYMLQKVFAINLFDLDFNTDSEGVFDFLVYLFPNFLKRALRQGLYREYQTRHYNDASVKGRIDISRHIKQNIPFTGKIAYTTREYAQDNHLTQLIRHTIEYISSNAFSGNILCNDNDTIDAVNLICSSTPTYNPNQRQQIMNQNLRSVSHPYYSEYIPLQQLCIQILKQEELKYGQEEDEIYGILFDGAWLWEEYLNTFLSNLDFEHTRNKEGQGRKYLFNNSKAFWCYPDFLGKNLVLDAKYKGYDNWNSVQINDLYQLISYMHIFGVLQGGFIVPVYHNLETKTLNGFGGEIGVWGIDVAFQTQSFLEYCNRISKSEQMLKERLKQI